MKSSIKILSCFLFGFILHSCTRHGDVVDETQVADSSKKSKPEIDTIAIIRDTNKIMVAPKDTIQQKKKRKQKKPKLSEIEEFVGEDPY